MKLARPRITAGIGLLLTTALTVTACGEPTTPATAPSASLPAATVAAASPPPATVATASPPPATTDVAETPAAAPGTSQPTEPTIDETVTPARADLTILRPGGIGPYRIGMDIEDLTRIAGGKRLPELVECGDVDASLYAPDLLSAGVGFGFDAGDDTTLHMLNVRDDTTATEKGVHVGSTQTQLTEVYGDDLQPLAGANAPSFTVEAGAHLLVFRIDEATQVVNSMGTVALGDTAHAVELVNTVC